MKRAYRRILIALVAASACATLSTVHDTAAAPTTFTVNSTADPGDGVCDVAECTLREAINASNANLGKDTIAFNIAGAGTQTIQPASELPVLIDAATMDATTQPSYAGQPLIVIDGINATGRGLRMGGNSEVAGFQITNFSTGIALEGDGNTVRANYIGTDGISTPGGGVQEFGIQISSGNLIGGSTVADRNVISGSDVGIFGNGNSNTISGNYFGTNASGTVFLGGFDIFIFNGANNIFGGASPGERNVIATGMLLSGGTQNSILGNFIGVDAAGVSLLSTSGDRVTLSGATETSIGGDSPGEGNVIAGGQAGIRLDRDATASIAGNLIGTDYSGTTFVGGQDGIVTEDSAGAVTIGGTTPDARNVITGTRSGVSLGRGGNVVKGNYIGTDVTGTIQLGGTSIGGSAIVMEGIGNVVGGLGPGEGNLIAGKFFGVIVRGTSGDVRVEGNLIGTQADGVTPLGSLGPGILIGATPDPFVVDFLGIPLARITENTIANNGIGLIVSDESRNVTIRSNSIHHNAALGIDLNPNSVNPNDSKDADGGANEGQNYPGLGSADYFGSTTRITGGLSSQPSTTYAIEFFANSECDAFGFGEGERPLELVDITSSLVGQAGFDIALSSPVAVGEFITATATDPDHNTSEFSACVLVTDDADGDGVLNSEDTCPNLAGPPDHDGCPEPGPPAVGGFAGLAPEALPPPADGGGSRAALSLAAALVVGGALALGGGAWFTVRRRR